jgi:hypothetical protein
LNQGLYVRKESTCGRGQNPQHTHMGLDTDSSLKPDREIS